MTIFRPRDSLNGSRMARKNGLWLIQRRLPDDGALIQRTRYYLLLAVRGPGEAGHGREMVMREAGQDRFRQCCEEGHLVGHPRYQSFTFR